MKTLTEKAKRIFGNGFITGKIVGIDGVTQKEMDLIGDSDDEILKDIPGDVTQTIKYDHKAHATLRPIGRKRFKKYPKLGSLMKFRNKWWAVESNNRDGTISLMRYAENVETTVNLAVDATT